MAQTSKYNFRILLETVEGSKLSYYSSSFVDTSQELVLSASQVYHRITGSFSSSYVNSKFTSSATTFEVISGSGNTFGENTLLSASLTGSLNTGSIVFTALDTEYDRLLRYKFIGDKVCSVLGLPSEQWIYTEQLRLPADNDSNYFEGNVKARNMYVDTSIQISNTAHVDSNIPILIHTQSAESSDRFLKFVEVDGIPKNALLLGYNASSSKYELSSSGDTTFDIANVNHMTTNQITSSVFIGGRVDATIGTFGATVTNGRMSYENAIHIKNQDIGLPDNSQIYLHDKTVVDVFNVGQPSPPELSVQFTDNKGLVFRQGASNDEKLIISGGSEHARIGIGDNVDEDDITHQLHVFGDMKVTGTGSFGKVHSNIVSSSIMFSSGSNIFGDADTDQHTFNGSISASSNLRVTGDISASGNLYAKTYRSERLYTFGSVTDGEEYYFPIGGNPYDSAVANANVAPALPLTQTAMCNLKIIRLKMQTAVSTSTTSTLKIYCRKWDGSSAFDNNSNWENVGTTWTVKSGNLVDNERFYHAPSDWTISAGEIWGLQIEHNGGSATLHMNGGIMIEEDWNNQVLS